MNLSRILLPMLALTIAMPALADFKMGYVNIERLYREAAPAVAAQKRLEQECAGRDGELKQRADTARDLKQTLDKGKLSANDRKSKELDLVSIEREFQQKQGQLRAEFTTRRNEEFASVLDRANQAVLDIAKKEGYDLIVQEAVYVNPKHDLTERILKAMDN